jgi:hypothetical protein
MEGRIDRERRIGQGLGRAVLGRAMNEVLIGMMRVIDDDHQQMPLTLSALEICESV